MYIWAGTYIFDYLGPFKGQLWDGRRTSGCNFHGGVLDTLIFSYLFVGLPNRPYYVSERSCIGKKGCAVHIKTDLIAGTHPTDF